ncbi:hypothetical protein KIN20_007423 [Parelaphostrongylus tenuis]|uniref:Uncharacterized protein n=1 Tax=Parelaphostrongylus tenuis TaxID=148309 RepID=A0AAD5MPP1_PARTN|nr:hypothetical protein KIN20_007423 [Parelaphostrongylus tenuis]
MDVEKPDLQNRIIIFAFVAFFMAPVSVVISFFLCWLPFHIQRLLTLFINYHEGNVPPAVEASFLLVYYISAILREKEPIKSRPQSYTKKTEKRQSPMEITFDANRDVGPSTRLLTPKEDCKRFDPDFKTTAILV